MLKRTKKMSVVALTMALLLVAVGVILPSKEAKAAVSDDGYTLVTQANFDEAKAHPGEQVPGNPVMYGPSKTTVFPSNDYQITADKVRFAENITFDMNDNVVEFVQSTDVDVQAKVVCNYTTGSTVQEVGAWFCFVGSNTVASIHGIGCGTLFALDGATVTAENGTYGCLEAMTKGKIVVKDGTVKQVMFSGASSSRENDGVIEIRGGTHTGLWIETNYKYGSIVKLYGGTYKKYSSDSGSVAPYSIRLNNTTTYPNEEASMEASAMDQLLADGYKFVGGEKTAGIEDWGSGYKAEFASIVGDEVKVVPDLPEGMVDNGDNTFTVSDPELGETKISASVVSEGMVYRMYNPNSGEHVYTKDAAEKDFLVSTGWNYEEDASFATIAATEESATPVYRVYNPNSGLHHYTMDKGEALGLKNMGWTYEGISLYVYDKNSSKGTAQYRLYNPNDGQHHWTVSEGEKDALVAMGWNDEGIAWRVK